MKYLAGMPVDGIMVKSPETADAAELIAVTKAILDETPFLARSAEEFGISVGEEIEYLRSRENDERGCMICAWLDGKLVGSASVDEVSSSRRLRHRATMGISVLREAWGRGVGSRLMDAVIQAAQSAGFRQLELEVAADNDRALRLYRSFGFAECGRLPGGMRRDGEDVELIQMVKPLV